MFKALKEKPALLAVLSYGFFVGSVIVLLIVIITMALKDLNRSREIETQTLLEKSMVLIRAFESGARTGMGMRWRHDQRQRLLEEMAYQPGVVYIAVTDPSGRILAHSDPLLIGTALYSPEEMATLKVSTTEQWRMATFTDQMQQHHNIFEVYRFFKPLRPSEPHRTHMMGRNTEPQRNLRDPRDSNGEQSIIFAAFDTETLDAMQAKDIRNTLVFLSILALLAGASILALFWARRYRHSRRQLQDTQAVSTEIISHLPIGLITTDHQQRIAVINQAAEKILGLDQAHLVGQSIHTSLPAEWNLLVKNSLQQRPVIEREIDCTLQGGGIIPLSISVASIVNGHGHSLGNIFIFRDMREIRRLQEEVRRKEKLAAIGNLAAGIAHEIRNPLSSIKGFAKYFEGRCAAGSEEQELASVMIREVDRLNRAITELLGLVRPSDLKIQQVDINQVIAHSLHLIRQDAESNHIAIHFAERHDLPAVEIDPDRFTQALLNLYLNAIQAIGKQGTLEVSLEPLTASRLQVHIQDSGAGIRQEDLDNIFNPYFTTKASGTGLGLAIVQKVIEEHQGSISVTSSPSQGTRFTLVIPQIHTTPPHSTEQTQEIPDHGNP